MARIPTRLLLALLLALCCLAAPALAAKANSAELTDAPAAASALHSIEGTVKLPRSGQKFVGARVLLNGGEQVALVRADGSFRFGRVAAGRSYTVDVAMIDFEFPTLRVDVSAKAGQRGRVSAVQLPTNQRVAVPLVLKPVAQAQYFQQREPVNVFGMLKNPMVRGRGGAAISAVRLFSGCRCVAAGAAG